MAGARILELFGDAATELCLRETKGRSEGLFRAYASVEFLGPFYSGDTVEVVAKVIRIGNTSRTIDFKAYHVKGAKKRLMTKATGTVVIPML